MKKPQKSEKIAMYKDILAINQHLHGRSLSEAQVIFYASTFIFSFLLTRIVSNKFLAYSNMLKVGLVVMTISSFIALFRVIFILKPFFFHAKVKQIARLRSKEHYKTNVKFNPFLFRSYSLFSSQDEFSREMEKVMADEEKTVSAYSEEVYVMGEILTRHYNIVNQAADILLTGLTIGVVFVAVGLLI